MLKGRFQIEGSRSKFSRNCRLLAIYVIKATEAVIVPFETVVFVDANVGFGEK